jgi:hypothetical protein
MCMQENEVTRSFGSLDRTRTGDLDRGPGEIGFSHHRQSQEKETSGPIKKEIPKNAFDFYASGMGLQSHDSTGWKRAPPLAISVDPRLLDCSEGLSAKLRSGGSCINDARGGGGAASSVGECPRCARSRLRTNSLRSIASETRSRIGGERTHNSLDASARRRIPRQSRREGRWYSRRAMPLVESRQ